MTYKEAARILDPETTLEAYAECEYYNGFAGHDRWIEDVNEACRIAAKVLREAKEDGEN